MNKENKNLNNDQKKEKIKNLIAWIFIVFSLLIIFIGVIISIIFTSTELNNGGFIGIPSLELSGSLVVATLISLVLLFILTYFLFWDKIKKHLEKRKEIIINKINDASKKNAQAQKNFEISEREIKNSNNKAKEIIEESKKEAIVLKREIQDSAKKESEFMLKRTREQIKREKDSMSKDIRNEIVKTSIIVAEKIISKKINNKSNEKMIEELIDELK